MPSPTPPILLVSNVYDTISLNTSGSLSASSEAPGHEVRYLADYRRERSWFSAATSASGHFVQSDLGLNQSASADSIFIDRGHSFPAGAQLYLQAGSAAGFGAGTYVQRSLIVPADGVVGGDPNTTTLVRTEEGALWAFVTPTGLYRYHRLTVDTALQPVITGLVVGLATRLLNFSSVWDPDSGTRVQRSEMSDAGWKATGRTTSYRKLMLQLQSIGSVEFDTTIRYLRRTLFERDQPAVVILDAGTYPERAWMYQLNTDSWDLPKTRATHSGPMPFREVGISV